jgi:Sec-independent protein secretion pathway component TatC
MYDMLTIAGGILLAFLVPLLLGGACMLFMLMLEFLRRHWLISILAVLGIVALIGDANDKRASREAAAHVARTH